ncbi:MAG: rhomboid family intramembrane serine protease [Lachnospiraceae bacterium]|nr:rhomboid family intramembrane serine protease [Lachnospiraceae bacterium]
MRPMSRFEKKFGRYAIPNLTTILILFYAVGYLLQYMFPELLNYMTLNPYLILHGQVWRLITWVVVPPSMGGILSVLIMMYFYWFLGTTLERTWGTWRYNVYMFSGMFFTILGSFAALGISYLIYDDVWWELASNIGVMYFNTSYINMSIFLAFAVTFPEMQVLLMFIIPIKVKWMGLVYGVMIVWQFIEGAKIDLGVMVLDISLFSRMAIVFSLLNFIVFYLTSRRLIISPKQIHRRQEFKREVHRSAKVTRHKCAICGRTDESDPDMEFRFCSKCNGNYEYCQDHLFTHRHVE